MTLEGFPQFQKNVLLEQRSEFLKFICSIFAYVSNEFRPSDVQSQRAPLSKQSSKPSPSHTASVPYFLLSGN
ncbi:hypothetical protein OIU79_024903 [Salix purpurea]|uniref:Uncharacterized protein n=1 Tax=Salix purpurea TaxID=77065 RepID=A0A9Q0W3Y0_SALPP|nr:hypothetical protein OIU79_024903 [Salix purpurea]